MDTQQPDTIKSLKVLFPYVKSSDKRKIPLLIFISFISALSELALAGTVALLASFFGSPEKALDFLPAWSHAYFLFLGDKTQNIIFMCMLMVLIAVLIKSALTVLTQYCTANLSESVAMGIKSKVMSVYTTAPYLWINKTGTTDMLFSLSAAQQLGNIFILASNIINHILTFILFFVGLLLSSFVPSLLLFTFMGAGLLIILGAVRGGISKRSRRLYNANLEIHQIQQLAVHALREIRLYGRGSVLRDEYSNKLRECKEASVSSVIFGRVPIVSMEALGFASLLLILGIMIWVQEAGLARITGTMGFLAAAAWRLLPVANRLLEHWAQAKNLSPYLQRSADLITESLHLEDSFDDKGLLGSSLDFKKQIEFKDLSFRYPGSENFALKNISFSLPKGKMLGVVGLSGAGKSTFLNIFSGLILPSDSSVWVDGLELKNANIAAWYRKIGYVSQSPYLLNASLAENIALSKWGEEIDRSRVLACCGLAALDFMDELSSGMDTILGEKGTRLSGGQAQRVVIARALYSKPEIIFFDEATSSLDIKNEKLIHETILSFRDKVTMIIVAHRLSAVEGCDYILWLDRGGVRRFGSGEDVLPEYKMFLDEQED